MGPACGAEEKPGGYRQLGPGGAGRGLGAPSESASSGRRQGPAAGRRFPAPALPPHSPRARVWLGPRRPAPRPLSDREPPWGWTPTATGARGLGPGPRSSQTPNMGESGPGAAGSGGAKPRGRSGPPRGCRGSGSTRIARTSVSASPSAAARAPVGLPRNLTRKACEWFTRPYLLGRSKRNRRFARNTPRRPPGPELCGISNAVGGPWFPGLPRLWAQPPLTSAST